MSTIRIEQVEEVECYERENDDVSINFRVSQAAYPSIYYLASNPQNFVALESLLVMLQNFSPIYTDTVTGIQYKLVMTDGILEKQEL